MSLYRGIGDGQFCVRNASMTSLIVAMGEEKKTHQARDPDADLERALEDEMGIVLFCKPADATRGIGGGRICTMRCKFLMRGDWRVPIGKKTVLSTLFA